MFRCLFVLMFAACTTHAGGPFDDPWTFTIESASIETNQLDGDSWDPDLSPPDPYVVVYVDDEQLDRTDEIANTYTPHWSFTTKSRRMSPGDTIVFEVQDSDTFTNDIVTRCGFTASADIEGPHRCSDATADLDIAINF